MCTGLGTPLSTDGSDDHTVMRWGGSFHGTFEHTARIYIMSLVQNNEQNKTIGEKLKSTVAL